ncbi:hypothetical protein C4579_04240 [Candidatus Microgenomates bacterium]|nr:MAG: hypothetical protein C4579_04240 [Candidatus Microgenomates bacterium]
MSTAETLYEPVSAITIPAHSYNEVHDEVITPPGFPLKRGHIPDLCIVVVNGRPVNRMQYPDSTSFIKLARISSVHGRSFKVGYGEVPAVLWQDEFGNKFQATSTKGNDLVSPWVEKSTINPSGFLYRGLQDSDSIIRVLRASRLIRANRGDTEVMTRLIEPEALPLDGFLMPVEVFKEILLHKIEAANLPDNSGPDMERSNVTLDDIPQLREKITRTKFFITHRDTSVAERLADFLEASTKEEFLMMLQKVFQAINRIHPNSYHDRIEEESGNLDINIPDHIPAYFASILPQYIVSNTAIFHNQELLHQYIHNGNVLASGGICDLDSVIGEPLGLGDPPVTGEQKINEFENVVQMYRDLLIKLSLKGFIPFPVYNLGTDDKPLYFSVEDRDIGRFMYLLYAMHRDDEVLEFMARAQSKFPSFGEDFKKLYEENPETQDIICNNLTRQLGWDYICAVDQKSMIKQIANNFTALFNVTDLQGVVEKMIQNIFTDKTLASPEIFNVYSELVMRKVIDDFQEQHGHHVTEIGDSYGEAVAQMVADVFITREYNVLMLPVFKIMLEEIDKFEAEASSEQNL